MFPDVFIRIAFWPKEFDGTALKDRCIEILHARPHRLDGNTPVKRMRHQLWVDCWWISRVGGGQSYFSFRFWILREGENRQIAVSGLEDMFANIQWRNMLEKHQSI